MIPKDKLLHHATTILEKAGIEDARREARLLLSWVLEKGLGSLFLVKSVSLEDEEKYQNLVMRRAQHEPLAFITGEVGFWTLDFYTSPATLIPRADSEALIEAVLKIIPDKQKDMSFLDLGTGTGCLLLSALSEYVNAWGVGIDLSPEAASLAQKNAKRNHLATRSFFVAAHWESPMIGQFDLVFSNPPYVKSADIEGLMPEVSTYEPARALDGGEDGLDAYRVLLENIPRVLTPNGYVVFEVGVDQIDDVCVLGQRQGFKEVLRQNDLGGIPRALVLQFIGK
ncbi:peptide chain release factor N(5)-glutamine methyltransferase [Swingsia samuiensis]|uniref:Release factor glutamine methyltransferase n=1 Tax=Swingsia samuiensis TaxID=1293412 RepID=A0A4Y6UHL4_9PROT|nr:peptide chain release factor N(5)-glutamine methyltransferase [Swingsia samuiensis]QDH16158.1 peptide chain release factor N(5)-glutamine methyltransferase [Swingsia samuiensis]